jgi:isopenicillin N synthase-like dioxygenase
MELRVPSIAPCPPRLFLAVTSRVVFLLLELGAFSRRHDAESTGSALLVGPSLAQHLLLCATLLRVGGGDDTICDAAALHSVYGTRKQRGLAPVTAALRARVAAAAGPRAERLAHLFSRVARPFCLLRLEGRCDAPMMLPERHGAGGLLVAADDVAALVDIEAANLIDQGDCFLRAVDAAPPAAPLRVAVERLRGVAARAGGVLPPVALPPPPPPPPPLCGALCAPCRWWPHRSRSPPAAPAPAEPPPAPLPADLPGCFLLDGGAGGPLCPPHLSPALLLPPSPLHAALPTQVCGAQAPTPAPLVAALERGECSPSPHAPGCAFSAAALRDAAASGGARAEALAVELAAGLARQGYVVVDAAADGGDGADAAATVRAAFVAAASFFDSPPPAKAACAWRSGALRKHAGYRDEGARELFAVRDDVGEACDGVWPEREWRSLFSLQRALGRDVFSLLAGAAGVGGSALSALFGCEGGLPLGAAAGTPASDAVALDACADVMRTYRYARRAGDAPPGLRAAATGAHTDVGLLTVSPMSELPGLVVLSPCGRHWLDVEGGEDARRGPPPAGAQRFVCFLGEAGARVLAAAPGAAPSGPPLRAPVHFVLERAGAGPRFSAPCFLRAPEAALLAPGLPNGAFLQALAQRPWVRLKADLLPHAWAADF